MAVLRSACVELCRTVDGLLEENGMWQTEALEFFNDFSLILYALVFGRDADGTSFDDLLRGPKCWKVI